MPAVILLICLTPTRATAGGAVWDRSASLGVSLTYGNSETLLANGIISVERTFEGDTFRLGVHANYGKIEIEDPTTGKKDDGTKINNAKAYCNYIRTVTDRHYRLMAFSIEHDKISGVDYRLTVGVGLGVHLLKKERTSWGIDLAPAYIREELTDGTSDDVAALRVGERFDHEFSEIIKIWQSVEYLADFVEFGSYLLNAEIGVEVVFKTVLGLSVVLQDKYDSCPTRGRENNDIALVTSLVYKY